MNSLAVFAGFGIFSGVLIMVHLWLDVLPKWVLYIWISSSIISLIGVFQENI